MTMSELEFCRRRRTSKYEKGDHVWFRNLTGWNEYGLPVIQVESGVILWCEDSHSVMYGIRPDSTPKNTFCAVSVQKDDMRKFRKNEKAE